MDLLYIPYILYKLMLIAVFAALIIIEALS